jgi:hypothetical protein
MPQSSQRHVIVSVPTVSCSADAGPGEPDWLTVGWTAGISSAEESSCRADACENAGDGERKPGDEV